MKNIIIKFIIKKHDYKLLQGVINNNSFLKHQLSNNHLLFFDKNYTKDFFNRQNTNNRFEAKIK